MPQAGQFTKSHLYVQRVLREKPKTTKGGTPIEITKDGWGIITRTGRSRNGDYSYYLPIDYPQLFGWDRDDFKAKKPIPLPVIEHKGYYYTRGRKIKA